MNRPALLENFVKWLDTNGYTISPKRDCVGWEFNLVNSKQLIERFFKEGN